MFTKQELRFIHFGAAVSIYIVLERAMKSIPKAVGINTEEELVNSVSNATLEVMERFRQMPQDYEPIMRLRNDEGFEAWAKEVGVTEKTGIIVQ